MAWDLGRESPPPQKNPPSVAQAPCDFVRLSIFLWSGDVTEQLPPHTHTSPLLSFFPLSTFWIIIQWAELGFDLGSKPNCEKNGKGVGVNKLVWITSVCLKKSMASQAPTQGRGWDRRVTDLWLDGVSVHFQVVWERNLRFLNSTRVSDLVCVVSLDTCVFTG